MNDLREYYLNLNRERNREYVSAKASLIRRQYRAKHPTHIVALKCMDGRLLFPYITKTPIGIIKPFRNIGGVFDLGWPYFGSLVNEMVTFATSKSRDIMFLATYHYSKSDTHRGCAGHNYDTASAIACSRKLVEQFDNVFGDNPHGIVYPILIGVETDEDALTLHGINDQILHLADETETDESDLTDKLANLYPDMNKVMLNDLLSLVTGNISHIQEVREANRPIIDLNHREHILGIGRGFDWLHTPNKALLIGPFSYDLTSPIAIGASILLKNVQEGRVNKEDGILVIVSSGYRDVAGFEKGLAIEKSKSLAALTYKTIADRVPEIEQYLNRPLIGTVNMNTGLFESID